MSKKKQLLQGTPFPFSASQSRLTQTLLPVLFPLTSAGVWTYIRHNISLRNAKGTLLDSEMLWNWDFWLMTVFQNHNLHQYPTTTTTTTITPSPPLAPLPTPPIIHQSIAILHYPKLPPLQQPSLTPLLHHHHNYTTTTNTINLNNIITSPPTPLNTGG